MQAVSLEVGLLLERLLYESLAHVSAPVQACIRSCPWCAGKACFALPNSGLSGQSREDFLTKTSTGQDTTAPVAYLCR